MAATKMRWVVFGVGGMAALASLVAAVVVSISLLWQGFAAKASSNQPYQPPAGAAIPVGAAAPDFAALDLDGNTVRLSDYKGKLVLLKIWSVTCGDCTVMLPQDQQIYNKLGDDVVLLTVAVQSSEKSVRTYVEQAKIDYPVLLDPDDSFMTLYNVKMTPTVYLIDPQGTIRSVLPVLGNAENINAYTEACGPACRPAKP